VHGLRGQCDALEHDARQVIDIEPNGAQGYGYLLAALATKGAPPEALQQLAHKEAGLLRDVPYGRHWRADDTARLAVQAGDLGAARAALTAMEADLANESDESSHDGLGGLVLLDEEIGEPAKAVAASEEFMRKLPAWSHDEATPWRGLHLATLRRAGRISEAEMRATGEAWIREIGPYLGPHRSDLWTFAYAFPAETPAEARVALEALPKWSPLPSSATQPIAAGAQGRAYALGGDAEKAVPLLRAEVDWCGPLPTGDGTLRTGWVVRAMQDRLLLGQALEQTGDRDGACVQYAAVLARWGSAKPRSVTADKARARARAIGCR
jgi:serine/threonine-protein kinase